MSIGKIMGKIVRLLPKTEGAAGRITLGRTQLEMLGKQDKKVGELVQKTLREVKEPKLDVAYKAESNYAIAGMRLRDGKSVIGQGAVSITNPGSSQAVIKYRASANGGKALQANGFLDGGKVADGKDMAVSLSRKGGKVKSDLEVGQATRHHIEFDEQQAVDLAKKLDAKNILQDYKAATSNLQRTLDNAMVDIRKGLRGEVPKVNIEKANKIMQKTTLSKAEITKQENIKKCMEKAEFKFDKISKESFLKKLKANKEITKKSFTDEEIDNFIKNFKKS